MTNVIVDARRCGEGKTYDHSPTAIRDKGRILSTWSIIKDRWQLSDRVLVVLPSLALSDAYEIEFIKYLDRQCPQGHTNQLAKITSTEESNVQAKLHEHMNARCAIIIITQAAFLQSQITHNERNAYHLIIDEAIMPYREIAVYHDEKCLVDFKWDTNSSLLPAPDMAVEWMELRFHNLQGNFITDSAEQTRFLFNANWRCRVHHLDYEKFAGAIPKNLRISIIQELLPTLFDNWISIWLACAAFDYTFMRHWMDMHGIKWMVHNKLQFKPHSVPMNIMGPDDLKFTWSSYKQRNEPGLITQFSQQVRQVANQDSVLVLRNNNQTRQVFNNELRLPHNSAGSNDYSNYKFISLESALNPTPNMTRFLYDVYGILSRGGSLDHVHMAQTVYTFYQTVMRSCLRQGLPATVFCLDNRVIMGMSEFFTDMWFEEIRLVRDESINSVGRRATGQNYTGPEKTFLSRKRKDPKYLGWTTEQIMELRRNQPLKCNLNLL